MCSVYKKKITQGIYINTKWYRRWCLIYVLITINKLIEIEINIIENIKQCQNLMWSCVLVIPNMFFPKTNVKSHYPVSEVTYCHIQR